MVLGPFRHHDRIQYLCMRGMGNEITVLGIFVNSIDSVCFYVARRYRQGYDKCYNWYVGVAALLTVGLNVITEFAAGYLFPGRPLANMMIKTYGCMTISQVRPRSPPRS